MFEKSIKTSESTKESANQEQEKLKLPDYLQEQKQLRQQRGFKPTKTVDAELILSARDLNAEQKIEKIKKETLKLENEAQRKELFYKGRTKNHFGSPVGDEVNSIYLNSIKAKLAALENFASNYF